MKAKNIALVITLIIIMGNLVRTGGLNDIRTVDFLQILATGMCLGGILVNLFSRSKTKT